MPNLVGTGNNQVPTNGMLGGLAYQDPAHANLTGVEIENIAAIKATINATPTSVLVYDTSNDSDGGAWRYKCKDKSWYTEQLGTSIRGNRKEFPSIAVIYIEGDYTYIHDGDDPNLPMWMKIEFTLGSGDNIIARMLNGMLVIGASNNGIAIFDFVSDRIQVRNHAHCHTYNQGIYPARQSRTDYDSITETGSSVMGSPRLGNETINDLDMVVEVGACSEPSTGLAIPTIGVAYGNNNADGGLAIIRGIMTLDHSVRRRDANGNYDTKNIKFSKDGRGYYWNSDYSPSDGHANMLKYSNIEITGSLSDFYGSAESVLANSWWAINRTDTAHDEVKQNWGVYKASSSNILFEDIVTWENRNAAVSTNGWGICRWKLYADPQTAGNLHGSGNDIIYNWVGCGYNSGWMPQGTNFNYINADLTEGTMSNGTTLESFAAIQANATSAGSLTVSAVNDNCQLKCVSGFSNSNYIANSSSTVSYGSNSSNLELTLMGWVNVTDTNSYSYLCSIRNGTNSHGAGLAVHQDSGSRNGQVYAYDTQQGALYSGSAGDLNITVNDGEWHHICCTWNSTSTKKLYVDGRYVAGATSSLALDLNAANHHEVGCWYTGTRHHNMNGKISLIRFINGIPSMDQIWKIYSDEKKMFDEGAQVGLYGTDNTIRGMDYDDSTGILHVGNQHGRSEFHNMVRINNTTTGIGGTRNISAAGGLVAERT